MARRIAGAAVLALCCGLAQAAPLTATARCEQRASALLDALSRADYAGAGTAFSAALAGRLPPAALETLWTETGAAHGALRVIGRLHGGVVNGRSEVFVPLMFEKTTVTADVVCDRDGSIGDFRLTPPRAH